MACITLNKTKLKHNFNQLQTLFDTEGITWAVVGKLLCGHSLFLEQVLELKPKQICDSRVSNLKSIKLIDPNIETIYIKPAPNGSIDEIVEYADISFNTELETIKLLSQEAVKQQKLHKIIIMVELGELREGVLREDLISFYEKVFSLPNIEIIGLGTNLTCMYGILPNNDKLIQLSLYKEVLELRFNKKLPFISGGASVTIPLITNHQLPKAINHFRIGETLFMGTNAYDGSQYEEYEQHIFELKEEHQIVGITVVLNTLMEGFIPEHILVYIATDQAQRGKGIGGKLIDHLKTTLTGSIALHVDFNNPAQHLYERKGFEKKYIEMRLNNK